MGSKRYKAKITWLEYRVKELEERLCPCESHDWKKIDAEFFGDDSTPMYMSTTYTYQCKRCGKRIKTWKPGLEE